jgi:hypothetical protein
MASKFSSRDVAKRCMRLSLLAVTVAFLLSVACDPDPDPKICHEATDSYQLSLRDSAWCAQAGQEVTPEGYCECVGKDVKYDVSSGQCISCSSTSCTGRSCGSDGCDGNCGRCSGGLSCGNDGACVACAGSCAQKQCGDDGCGRPCGICGKGFTCEGGQCIANDTSQIVTQCSCSAQPNGAYPGAWRPEARCPSGAAQFELCTTECPDGTSEWRETCLEFETGAIVAPCNCAPPPPGAQNGRRVDAPMCKGETARVWACSDYYGNPLWCSPYTVAWMAVCDTC